VKTEHPFAVYYHDQQAFAQIDTHESFAEKQNKKHFASLDLLLINGNHFLGDKQIVFINEKKKESLYRKLNRLTNLRIIIVENDSQEIHDFIKPLILDKVKVFTLQEIEKVAHEIMTDTQKYIAPLHGLVLAGGKSIRMGKDKGALNYHGKPQREYEADMLKGLCENVFISFSQNQTDNSDIGYPIIKDTFTGLGPYGAILSAFREHPNHAWLTVACDLPLLNEASLILLAQKRNPSKLATCFHNPETKFPEPSALIINDSQFIIIFWGHPSVSSREKLAALGTALCRGALSLPSLGFAIAYSGPASTESALTIACPKKKVEFYQWKN